MTIERKRSWQDGIVRPRPRKNQPDVWDFVYRRYDQDGTSKRVTVAIGDKTEFPLESDVSGSDKLVALRTLINKQNGVDGSVVFFGDLAALYRKRYIPNEVRPKVQITYNNNLDWLEEKWGDWRLDKLSESLAEVQEWFNGDMRSKKTGEPLANQSRKHIARLLSNVYKNGVMWKVVKHNPWGQLRVNKGAEPVERDFDVEKEMFWFLIDDPETPRHVRMMVIVAMCNGLGIEEILGLKWEDIDFRRGWMNIKRTWVEGHEGPAKPKARKAPSPLTPWLAQELNRYKEEVPVVGDWLFGSIRTGKPFYQGMLSADHLGPALRRMGANFGVIIPRNTGFHAFRHTYITSLDVLGTSLKVAQSLARHAGPAMTMRYINKGRRHQDAMRAANAAVVREFARTGTDGD